MQELSKIAASDLNRLTLDFENDEKIIFKSPLNGKLHPKEGKKYLIIFLVLSISIVVALIASSNGIKSKINSGRGFPDPIGYDPISHVRLYAKSDFDNRDKLNTALSRNVLLLIMIIFVVFFGVTFIYSKSIGFGNTNYIILTNKNIYKRTVTLNKIALDLNIKIKNADVASVFIDKLSVRVETNKGTSFYFFMENPELFDKKFKANS